MPRKPCLDNTASPVYNKDTSVWSFRVHVDCWDMVSSRVSDPIILATNWCRILIALNGSSFHRTLSRKQLDTPFLLLPRSSKHDTKGNYRRLSLETHDSFDGLEVELALPKLLAKHSPIPIDQLGIAQAREGTVILPNNNRDAFSRLPRELLQLVFQNLATSDLLNLRLASRTVSLASGVENLPRSFWFSRFTPSFEMGFALPTRIDEDLDWRGLYFLIRRACKQGSQIPAPQRGASLIARLIKRKYWWERFEMVVNLCGSRKPGGAEIVRGHIPGAASSSGSGAIYQSGLPHVSKNVLEQRAG
ncbi:hypothetical protein QBC42DRAFT_166458 [Cladorrhinum samala]|uniref:F-box domain-containing protein n=1 Tax=Cladorrhinum samala TaxID=585594 RepID=A0AAV9I535_9PEZI|nr:hypothetical protein QBC42DRAFT_166458 [Cladorrhinum samala]